MAARNVELKEYQNIYEIPELQDTSALHGSPPSMATAKELTKSDMAHTSVRQHATVIQDTHDSTSYAVSKIQSSGFPKRVNCCIFLFGVVITLIAMLTLANVLFTAVVLMKLSTFSEPTMASTQEFVGSDTNNADLKMAFQSCQNNSQLIQSLQESINRLMKDVSMIQDTVSNVEQLMVSEISVSNDMINGQLENVSKILTLSIDSSELLHNQLVKNITLIVNNTEDTATLIMNTLPSVKSVVHQMNSKVTDIQSNVKLVKSVVNQTNSIVTDNQLTLNSVKSTVGETNSSVVGIQSTVSSFPSIKSAINQTKSTVTNIQSTVNSVKSTVDETKTTATHIDAAVDNWCGSGGWTKIAYLDMKDPLANCPSAFAYKYSNGIRACARPFSNVASCTSVYYYPPSGTSYSEVCGRVVGYQYGHPKAVSPLLSIDTWYVDGISITHGNPRQHVWSFINGRGETASSPISCPCNSPSQGNAPPSFVGNDYFCESGSPHVYALSGTLYSNDPLWDGKDCGGYEANCCTGLPWFRKTLSSATSSFIEIRNCGEYNTEDENVYIELYEIYVK